MYFVTEKARIFRENWDELDPYRWGRLQLASNHPRASVKPVNQEIHHWLHFLESKKAEDTIKQLHNKVEQVHEHIHKELVHCFILQVHSAFNWTCKLCGNMVQPVAYNYRCIVQMCMQPATWELCRCHTRIQQRNIKRTCVLQLLHFLIVIVYEYTRLSAKLYFKSDKTTIKTYTPSFEFSNWSQRFTRTIHDDHFQEYET
jgi:hypothetical protein